MTHTILSVQKTKKGEFTFTEEQNIKELVRESKFTAGTLKKFGVVMVNDAVLLETGGREANC